MSSQRAGRDRDRDPPESPVESHRPALERLTLDVAGIRSDLFDGFETRRAVLRWEQRVSIRTLGELPQRFFHRFARQFRLDNDGDQPTLLASVLVPDARTQPVTEPAATDLRERLYSTYVLPAFHLAFRKLRADAGEYIDDDETLSGHDPSVQRYVAMRPAVDELERYQQKALASVLDGFESSEKILTWGDRVEKATHGEIDAGFIPRCHREGSTRQLLLGEMPGADAARELFAAHYLLPAFNRGVRDLAGRTGESPTDDTETDVHVPTG